MADEFRQYCKVIKYGIVDIFDECERCGFKLVRYPIGEDGVLGFVQNRDDDKIIFSNSSVRLSREIFTIAHEIGHLCLHMKMRESYLEDGSKSTEFVDAEVYAFVDGYYYVDESLFNVGDKLLMPDSEATYTVSKQDTLVGVFNINKGYADFKEITILNANDEYSIVKSNSEYGLNVYDHIVLKGDTVSDRDFIYE